MLLLRLPLSPRLTLPFILLLTACGPLSVERVDHRTENPHASGEGDEVEAKPSQRPTDTADRDDKPAKASKEPKTPQDKTTYDEALDRSASLFFYQSAPDLSDLFAPNGTSQLCWPTTLAYTLESLRTAHVPPLTKLEKANVRDLYAACGTDRKIGTTMPQGVTCAAGKLTTAGYEAQLKVTGLDAKWKTFGLYPANTDADESVVSPAVLRQELNAGSSVILFVGYYRLDTEKNVWTRARGHFITITGFGYRADWDDEVLDLHVVNPGNDYEGDSHDDALQPDVVRMSRITATAALPKEVAFELRGPHFEMGENAVAAIESVLEIRAK